MKKFQCVLLLVILFTSLSNLQAQPTLSLPTDNSTGISLNPTLSWSGGISPYTVNIYSDATLTTLVETVAGVIGTSTATSLVNLNNTQYWWTVTDALPATSGSFSFTTIIETPNLNSPANSSINISVVPTLTWNSVTGAVTYDLEIAQDAGFTTGLQTFPGLTSTSFTFTSPLMNSTLYYWHVRASDGTNNTVYSGTWTFTTIRAVQPYLGWPLGGTQIYTPQVYFSWYLNEAGTGVTYDFMYSTDPGMSGATIIPVSTTYYSMGGFLPGTVYYWQVRTKLSGLVSRYSTIESFISYGPTTTPLPSWPTGGATVYVNPPTLYWYLNTANQGLTFDIEWNSTGVFTGTPTIGYSGIGNLYQQLPNLPAGTYYWKVRSYNGTNYSTWSAMESFIIQGNATPLQPILAWPVGGAIVYSGSTLLSWYLAGTSYGLTYDIEINTSGVFTGIPNFTGIVDNYYNYSGLIDGTTYYWRVRSYDGTTYSSWSNPESFTVFGSPTDITPFCLWPVGGASVYSTTVDLCWYLNSYFAGMTFDIEYNTTGIFTGTPTVTGITNTYFQLNGLIPGTTYYWRVRSINGLTISNWSGGESFIVVNTTGSQTPICGWPVGGAVVYQSTQNLYWYLNGPSVGLTYDIEYNTTGSFTGTPDVSGITDTYYQLAGLTSGTYYWRVRAFDGVNYSPWSTDANFVVSLSFGPMRPVAGSPINGVTIPTNSPTLAWYLPAGSSSLTYEVQYSTSPLMTNPVSFSTNNPRIQTNSLNSGITYYWRVRSRTISGQYSEYSKIASFIASNPTGIDEKNIPSEYELVQNYPNPFNPNTMIKFNIPVDSKVELIVYNSLGEIVTKLVDAYKPAGQYNISFDASKLTSGVYFYKLIANNFVSIKKMLLIK